MHAGKEKSCKQRSGASVAGAIEHLLSLAVNKKSDHVVDTAHGRRKSPLSASLWCGGVGRRGDEELVGGRRSGDHHGKLRESNHSAQEEASIFGSEPPTFSRKLHVEFSS